MYKLNVSFTDYAGKARREDVMFNLDAREVFKLLPELKSVFDWIESNKDKATDEPRDLGVEEVRDFYTSLEGIMLEAYGEMSEDGQYFRKAGKFEFEESAAFNACMWLFVSQPKEGVELLKGILPKELYEIVQNADEDQIAEATSSKLVDQQKEIADLRAQLAAKPPEPRV